MHLAGGLRREVPGLVRRQNETRGKREPERLGFPGQGMGEAG